MNANDFSKIDAQSPESSMAQMSPVEQSEYIIYLAEISERATQNLMRAEDALIKLQNINQEEMP